MEYEMGEMDASNDRKKAMFNTVWNRAREYFNMPPAQMKKEKARVNRLRASSDPSEYINDLKGLPGGSLFNYLYQRSDAIKNLEDKDKMMPSLEMIEKLSKSATSLMNEMAAGVNNDFYDKSQLYQLFRGDNYNADSHEVRNRLDFVSQLNSIDQESVAISERINKVAAEIAEEFSAKRIGSDTNPVFLMDDLSYDPYFKDRVIAAISTMEDSSPEAFTKAMGGPSINASRILEYSGGKTDEDSLLKAYQKVNEENQVLNQRMAKSILSANGPEEQSLFYRFVQSAGYEEPRSVGFTQLRILQDEYSELIREAQHASEPVVKLIEEKLNGSAKVYIEWIAAEEILPDSGKGTIDFNDRMRALKTMAQLDQRANEFIGTTSYSKEVIDSRNEGKKIFKAFKDRGDYDLFEYRGLDRDTYLSDRFKDTYGHMQTTKANAREWDLNNMVFKNFTAFHYHNSQGEIVGMEYRNRFKSDLYDKLSKEGYDRSINVSVFAKNSKKNESLWLSKRPEETRQIMVFESAIDAMSHYQMNRGDELFREHTWYMAVGGKLELGQIQMLDALRSKLGQPPIVLGFDRDHGGREFALLAAALSTAGESPVEYGVRISANKAMDIYEMKLRMEGLERAGVEKFASRLSEKNFDGTPVLSSSRRGKFTGQVSLILPYTERNFETLFNTLIEERGVRGMSYQFPHNAKDWNDVMLNKSEPVRQSTVSFMQEYHFRRNASGIDHRYFSDWYAAAPDSQQASFKEVGKMYRLGDELIFGSLPVGTFNREGNVVLDPAFGVMGPGPNVKKQIDHIENMFRTFPKEEYVNELLALGISIDGTDKVYYQGNHVGSIDKENQNINIEPFVLTRYSEDHEINEGLELLKERISEGVDPKPFIFRESLEKQGEVKVYYVVDGKESEVAILDTAAMTVAIDWDRASNLPEIVDDELKRLEDYFSFGYEREKELSTSRQYVAIRKEGNDIYWGQHLIGTLDKLGNFTAEENIFASFLLKDNELYFGSRLIGELKEGGDLVESESFIDVAGKRDYRDNEYLYTQLQLLTQLGTQYFKEPNFTLGKDNAVMLDGKNVGIMADGKFKADQKFSAFINWESMGQVRREEYDLIKQYGTRYFEDKLEMGEKRELFINGRQAGQFNTKGRLSLYEEFDPSGELFSWSDVLKERLGVVKQLGKSYFSEKTMFELSGDKLKYKGKILGKFEGKGIYKEKETTKDLFERKQVSPFIAANYKLLKKYGKEFFSLDDFKLNKEGNINYERTFKGKFSFENNRYVMLDGVKIADHTKAGDKKIKYWLENTDNIKSLLRRDLPKGLREQISEVVSKKMTNKVNDLPSHPYAVSFPAGEIKDGQVIISERLERRLNERPFPARFWDEYNQLTEQKDIKVFVEKAKPMPLPHYFQKEFENLKEMGEDYFRFKGISQRLRLNYEDQILWMESKDTVMELGNLDQEGNLRFSNDRELQPLIKDLVDTMKLEYEVEEKDFRVNKGLWVDERIREEKGMPLYLNTTVIGHIDEDKGIQLDTDMIPAEQVKAKLGTLEEQFEVNAASRKFQKTVEEKIQQKKEQDDEVRFSSKIGLVRTEEPSAIMVMHVSDYNSGNDHSAFWINVNGFEQGEGDYLRDEIQAKLDELTEDDGIDRDFDDGYYVVDKSGLIASRGVSVNDENPDLELYIEEHLKAAGKFSGVKIASEAAEAVQKEGAEEVKESASGEKVDATEVVEIEEVSVSREEFEEKLQENGETLQPPEHKEPNDTSAEEEVKAEAQEAIAASEEKAGKNEASLYRYPYEEAFPISEDTTTDERWRGMIVGRESDIVFTVQNQRNVFFDRDKLEAQSGHDAHEDFEIRSTILLGNALRTTEVDRFILAENPREMLSYYELNKGNLKYDAKSLMGSYENGFEKEGRVDKYLYHYIKGIYSVEQVVAVGSPEFVKSVENKYGKDFSVQALSPPSGESFAAYYDRLFKENRPFMVKEQAREHIFNTQIPKTILEKESLTDAFLHTLGKHPTVSFAYRGNKNDIVGYSVMDHNMDLKNSSTNKGLFMVPSSWKTEKVMIMSNPMEVIAHRHLNPARESDTVYLALDFPYQGDMEPSKRQMQLLNNEVYKVMEETNNKAEIVISDTQGLKEKLEGTNMLMIDEYRHIKPVNQQSFLELSAFDVGRLNLSPTDEEKENVRQSVANKIKEEQKLRPVEEPSLRVSKRPSQGLFEDEDLEKARNASKTKMQPVQTPPPPGEGDYTGHSY
jgi:hypothetical protein